VQENYPLPIETKIKTIMNTADEIGRKMLEGDMLIRRKIEIRYQAGMRGKMEMNFQSVIRWLEDIIGKNDERFKNRIS
jgi:hypothetical protein